MTSRSWVERVAPNCYRVFINNIHEGDYSYQSFKSEMMKRFPHTRLDLLVSTSNITSVPLENHYNKEKTECVES